MINFTHLMEHLLFKEIPKALKRHVTKMAEGQGQAEYSHRVSVQGSGKIPV